MATEDAAHIALMVKLLAVDLLEAFHPHTAICDAAHTE
jgi:hypothetical protein